MTITGWGGASAAAAVSRGKVVIQTSEDPVGAPIFYRDVPLMPSELQKGVIKPLAPNAIPLIAWRLRNIGEKEQPRAVYRNSFLRQLPFLFPRRQDPGDGPGRPRQRQGALRAGLRSKSKCPSATKT